MYINPSSNEFIQLTQVMNDFLLAEQAPQLDALAERTPPDLLEALAIVVARFSRYQAEHEEAQFAELLHARLEMWCKIIKIPVPTEQEDQELEEIEEKPADASFVLDEPVGAVNEGQDVPVGSPEETIWSDQDVASLERLPYDMQQPYTSMAFSPPPALNDTYFIDENYRQARKTQEQNTSSSGKVELLVLEATAYSKHGQPDKALEYYQQALREYKQGQDFDPNDYHNYMDIHVDMGNTYVSLGRYEEARDILRLALKRARRYNHLRDEALILTNIGNIHSSNHEYDEALAVLQQVLQIGRQLEDRSVEANALANMSNINLQLRNFEQAREYALQALNLFKDLFDWQNMSRVLDLLATIELGTGQATEALKHFEQSLEMARRFENKQSECKILCDLSYVYVAMKEFPPARKCAEQALEIARQHKLLEREALALGHLAVISHFMEDHQDALEYGQEGLSKAHLLANDRHIARINMVMGSAYSRQEMYFEAIKHLKKAIELYNMEQYPGEHTEAQLLLTEVYIQIQEFDLAIEHSERALTAARQFGHPRQQVNILRCRSFAYLRKQEFYEAIKSCQEGLALLPADENSLIKGFLLQCQGQAHSELAQYEEALACYRQARPIFEQLGLPDLVAMLDQDMDRVEALSSGMAPEEDYGRRHLEREEFRKAIEHYEPILLFAREEGDIRLQADCLKNIGLAHEGLRQYACAIDHLQQAIAFYRETGQTILVKELEKTIARVRTKQQQEEWEREQNLAGTILRLLTSDEKEFNLIIKQNPVLMTSEAKQAFDEVRAFYKGQPAKIATLNEVEKHFQELGAMGMNKVIMENPLPDDLAAQVVPLINELIEIEQKGLDSNPERTIELAKQGLALVSKSEHSIVWAFFHFSLGSAWLSVKPYMPQDLEEAIAGFKQSLEVLTREEAPLYWAKSTSLLGIAYARRIYGNRAENIEQAIRHFELVLEVTPKEELYQDERGMTLADVGTAYTERIRGDRIENLERALAYHKQALEIIRPDNRPNEWVNSILNTGNIYLMRQRGKFAENMEQAIQYYNKGLQVARRYPQQEEKRFMILHQLAKAHLGRQYGDRTENIEHAIAYYEEVLEVLTRDKAAYWANVINNLAGTYLMRKRGKRIENIQHAIDLLTDVPNVISRENAPQEWAHCMNILGLAYRGLSSETPSEEYIRRAEEAYEAATKVLTLETMPERYFDIKHSLGLLSFKRRDWARTYDNLAEAFKAHNLVYQSRSTPESRQDVLKTVGQSRANHAYSLAKMGRFMGAVATLEEGKARALNEVLARNEAALEAATDELRATFTRLRGRIAMLEAEARLQGQPGARKFLDVSSSLTQARQELKLTVERIRKDVPEFMPQGLDSGGIVSVAKRLGQPLVYLLTTQYGSLALIVSPRSQKVVPIWRDDFQTSKLSTILYKEGYLLRTIERAGMPIGANIKNLETVLEQIRPQLNKLMRPIATHLAKLGAQQAVLIPTGTLSLLPLHALVPSVNFSVVPSARTLQTALDRQKKRAHLPPTLLGIGNPLPNPNPLAFARLEVEDIVPLFPNEKAFYEQSATRHAVISNLRDSTHLHFSCHGAFNIQKPLESGLYLAGKDTLTLRDLLDGGFDLSATRLAVLSACQTGITDFLNVPDEAVGLPAGFLQAGVPGVISTLWPVADISTALLLIRFYRYHLEEGLAPAIALHNAQKWLREATAKELKLADYYKRQVQKARKREEKAKALHAMRYYRNQPNVKPFAHPYYWAAFVFSGV